MLGERLPCGIKAAFASRHGPCGKAFVEKGRTPLDHVVVHLSRQVQPRHPAKKIAEREVVTEVCHLFGQDLMGGLDHLFPRVQLAEVRQEPASGRRSAAEGDQLVECLKALPGELGRSEPLEDEAAEAFFLADRTGGGLVAGGPIRDILRNRLPGWQCQSLFQNPGQNGKPPLFAHWVLTLNAVLFA